MFIPDAKQSGQASGFTLVELVAYVAIVSMAVAGVLLAYNAAGRDSPDPLLKQQALAIAESLLEEIQQMPFTFCDPDDPTASTATSTATCSIAEGLGPEAGESRYSATSPFDNVNDYHGYDTAAESPSGIKDVSGAAIAGLVRYNASVNVAPATLGGIAAGDALLVTVRVVGPGSATVRLDTYRTRHAPRL